MKEFFLGLISDGDGRSDEMAVLSIIGVATFIGLEIFSVVLRRQPFIPDQFGLGFGSVIGTAALGMGLKSRLGK